MLANGQHADKLSHNEQPVCSHAVKDHDAICMRGADVPATSCSKEAKMFWPFRSVPARKSRQL